MRLNNSIENWQNYLSFSSNMYSYGYADILKVYYAEPTATAVATLEEWNRMGRFINPKAKGFIFSDGHIRYDIKDTNGASVRKWQFTSGHIPFYYDHFNAMNITDNVMLDNGNDFSVNICDFLCEMMSKDKSLSGVVNENVREIAALSTTYVICERLGIDKNETYLDLSAITSLSDEEVNLTATITAIYARSMLKAAQRTVSSVTKEQIEERGRNVMFTAEELSEFEDITDAVYDEEISEETTVETAEDAEKKYTVPETLVNVTADNDNDDIIQENKSVVTVQPVSEVSDSGLTAEKQQEILETALMIDNGSINKERINALFSGNIGVNALTSYVRSNYKGKSYNSTNDDIISAYLARNDCFVVRYNIDGNAGNLSFDWQTVTNTIDKLIREDRFIAPKEQDNTAEETTSLTLHKVGDFWEMYDNDARAASEALGLYLSRKGKVAMCGFPDKEKDNYTQRLRDAGFIIINDNIPENKKETLPDSITIKFGTENDPELTSESKLLDDLITKYRNEHNGNDMSFALANAVIEYLDEKQHIERADKENKVGWYNKTWFTVTATISGEQFSYDARFASDFNGSGRAKQVVQNLISCNIVMIAVIFILRLYIYVLISAQDKNYPFTVLIALTVGGAMFVIDGPDLIVKILGVDAGVKSGAAAIMSIRSASQIASSAVSSTTRTVGSVVKKSNTAAASVVGGLKGLGTGAVSGAKTGSAGTKSAITKIGGNPESAGGKIASHFIGGVGAAVGGAFGGVKGLSGGYLSGENEARNSQGSVSTVVHGAKGVYTAGANKYTNSSSGGHSNTSTNTNNTSSPNTSNSGKTDSSTANTTSTSAGGHTDTGSSNPTSLTKGEKGDGGQNGYNGQTGQTGQTGQNGMDGKDGRNGTDGLNGHNGTSSNQIGNAFNKPVNKNDYTYKEPTNQQVYDDLNN